MITGFEEKVRSLVQDGTPLRLVKGLASVTIYQQVSNYKYKVYLVTWRLGRRRMRRGKNSVEEAINEAKRILKELADGRGALTQTDVSTLMYYQECERMLGSTPLHVACKEYLRLTGQGESTVKRKYVKEVVQEFLAVQQTASDRPEGERNRYLESLHYMLDPLAQAFTKGISEVSKAELETYLSSREWSAKTRKNHRGAFVQLWSYARRAGYLPADRQTVAETLEEVRVLLTDPNIFTPNDYSQLLHKAAEDREAGKCDLVPYLVIGGMGGIRQAELLRLEWSDFNWEEKLVALSREKTKTQRRRTVPLTPVMEAWLDQYRSKTTGKIVTVRLSGLVKQISQLAGACAVAWPHNGLRHSFASYHYALHGNPALTSAICGHTIQQLEAHYKALVTPTAAREWFGIMPGYAKTC